MGPSWALVGPGDLPPTPHPARGQGPGSRDQGPPPKGQAEVQGRSQGPGARGQENARVTCRIYAIYTNGIASLGVASLRMILWLCENWNYVFKYLCGLHLPFPSNVID